MLLAAGQTAAPFLAEPEALPGVRRVAEKVTKDVERVSGIRPSLWDVLPEGAARPRELVLCATLGHSPLADALTERGLLDPEGLAGRREVYELRLLERPFPGVEQLLVIWGSDLLGTIYGLFRLSELIGVSPLWDWGDARPERRETLELGPEAECRSKEPSVRYRGFFINDEWPCFGTWATEHYGGFNAQLYDRVFELLLRLRGNCLWPAMWTASFPLDGPGSANEALADLYGIYIGYSHHEPCLRASEEWDLERGVKAPVKDALSAEEPPEQGRTAPYGDAWSYRTNAEGLTRYWADGLRRSGKYRHIVTIGMRGERDTAMLGAQSSREENVRLLQRIIRKQRELIRAEVNPDIDRVPQLLALYKEVEAYFYGDGETPGLKDWDELEQVIFMLCEDNFGHTRTLPTEEMRSHPGGFGMYYHLDYHGGPVSYEWLPSTPLARIWEQMTQTYEHGIRTMWMVNVGDLKGNEVALSYFMALAYDYERWGSTAPNRWPEFMALWARQNFPRQSETVQREIAGIYTEFVRLNAIRRPESLHPGVYHPCHEGETDRILARAEALEGRCAALEQALDGTEEAAPFFSMVGSPARRSVNLLKMHLYAGKNAHYAAQGRKAANGFGQRLADCIQADRALAQAWAAFRDGKWRGMELAKHIGFVQWNEDGWRYPVRQTVEPNDEPRMSVSRADGEAIAIRTYGGPMTLKIDDFCSPGVEEVLLEISNDGRGTLSYTIAPERGASLPDWLELPIAQGQAETLARVPLRCRPALLPPERQTVRLLVSDGWTTVALEVSGQEARTQGLPAGTFLPRRGVIVMEASHFWRKTDTERGRYVCLKDAGRDGDGMKVLPSTVSFASGEKAPSLTYAFALPRAGRYTVQLWTTPTNPTRPGAALRLGLECAGQRREAELLPADFRAGECSDTRWAQGVLEQIRKTEVSLELPEGFQTLTVLARDEGVILERILLYPERAQPQNSCLGPAESLRMG